MRTTAASLSSRNQKHDLDATIAVNPARPYKESIPDPIRP